MTITEEKCEVQSFESDLSGGCFAQYDVEMLGMIEARFIAQAVLHLYLICEQPIQKTPLKKILIISQLTKSSEYSVSNII